MNAGILPVKALGSAKGRLAAELPAAARREVAAALFADALDLCAEAPFLHWFVVSDDGSVLEKAAAHGFTPVEDPGRGLNPALEVALSSAIASGAQGAAIVPADLPLATRADLVDLVDTGAISDVVVVPAGDGGGTNGLYMSPPGLMRVRFGDGSLAVHMAEAQEAGLRCSLLPLAGMALDIDTISDVDELLEGGGRPRSRAYEALRRLRRPQA